MDSTVPSDLLKLKARLETWRATRKHQRQPIPDQFRQAAAEMARRYSPSLVRRVLKLDPWKLKGLAGEPAHTRNPPLTAFFTLPPETLFPEPGPPAPQNPTGCRLQIERPDGSRLTLTMPALDIVSTRQLFADFLRDGNQ